MKKLILLSFLFPIAVEAQDQLKQFADGLADEYLVKNSGSLIIGINDNGNERLYYYGETEKGNRQKPDSSSIYELGHLTSTFTCILYGDLSIKGIIHEDDKLKSFFPPDVPLPVYQKELCKPADDSSLIPIYDNPTAFFQLTAFKCFPDPSTRPQEIILCDLGTHTTGLPTYPDNLKIEKYFKDPHLTYSKADLYAFLKKYRFKKPLGDQFNFSVTGISLLGYALTVQMQKDFDSLITEHLLVPLGMYDTRINLLPKLQPNPVTGYHINKKVNTFNRYDILSPALGLHSSVKDMMKFLSKNINSKKDYYTDLLDFTHNPRLKLLDKKNKNTEIALGWKTDPLNDHYRAVWQSSSGNGYAAYIGFVEPSHTGILILSSNDKDVSEIGKKMLAFINNK